MKSVLPCSRGFTLVELVIVFVLLGIMAAALLPLAVSSVRTYGEVVDNVVVLDKIRYATERLAREIREVNYSSTGFAFASAVTACNNTMRFTRTAYDSSGVATGDTYVRICTQGTNLTLNYAANSTAVCPTTAPFDPILTDELSSVQFCYRQTDGTTAATSTSDVRYVDISITLQHSGTAQPFNQTTRVELKRYEKP